MSPPKVSLAGKNTPKLAGGETLTDGSESPAVVTFENERNVHLSRRECHRRRRIICGIAFFIIISVAFLGTLALVFRMRHHRRSWSVHHGKKHLNENVTVDQKHKLITVQHDHDEETKTPAMQILHEYGRGIVAFKDVDKKICYIDRLDETFEDGYERWEAYEKHDRKGRKTLRVISKPIEIEVVRHICDVHITAHCSDFKSVWVMEIEETKVTTEMKVVYV